MTARDFAQTLGLLERFRIDHTAIGHHRGGKLAAKGVGLRQRSRRAHALGERPQHRPRARPRLQRRLASPPSCCGSRPRPRSTTSGRASSTRSTAGWPRASSCPTRSRPSGWRRYGATAAKLRRYEGLKEEYYLADFEPDPAVLAELGLDRARPLAVVRTPPAVSLYHRFDAPVFTQVLHRLKGEQVVVLPRTPEQRAELAREGGFIVPERAIDAQSLVAFADLVISAGGTMNREAVALGTPVWTTFEGRLGAVDERLIADGRMLRLTRAEDVVLETPRRTARAAASACAATPSIFTDLFVKAG